MAQSGRLNAPACPRGQIIVAASAAYPRNDEATAVQLTNGDILLAWSRFESLNRKPHPTSPTDHASGLPGHDLESDNAGSSIVGIVSSDGGQSWHDEHMLVENTAGLNVMNPSLARLPDGGLGLVYNQRESTTEAYRVFRRSDDEGKTWSAPVLITHQGYQTGCNDRLTVLRNGRLIAPIHGTDDWHSHYLYTRVAWSDDGGAHWQLSSPLELPRVASSGESGAWEADAVERADGSLLLIMRTAMGTIFRAESHDGGESWSGLRSMEVVAPVAPSIIRRLPGSDALLLIWNWHYDWREPMGGVRCPLACAISTDGGASWLPNRRKIIEADPGFTYAYPSCLFVGETALVTYYVSDAADPFGARSLKLMHIPIQWLLDETDSSYAN
ncbi:MAG: exo-alpha-sialidase [Anaerolineae bacterium]|nr:exo-alpha-sialidase [Anaerolineae bacterium]